MPRDTLTREQIVRAAVELLDAEGLEGLSMRRLGRRLGSAATAVYWHVESKDRLVVLAGDAVWDEVGLPDPGVVGWRAAATAMATDLYAMVMRHPWLVPAMGTQLLYGPGKARHDDHLLAVYEAAGFSGPDAEHAASVVVTFVLGTALGASAEAAWRARVRRSGGDEDQIRAALSEATETALQFPRLRAHADAWAEGDQAEASAESDPGAAPAPAGGLEFGLRTILDGLEVRLAARP